MYQGYQDEEYMIQKIDELLEVARGELGVEEDAGKDEDSNGRIAAFRAAVTYGDVDPYRGPEAWCADFVSWCYLQIGHPLGPKKKGFRSCTNMMNWFIDQNAYFDKYEEDMRPGDVIFIDGNKNNDPDHVGLIERINGPEDIITIEGNYGNKCTRVHRTRWGIVMGVGIMLE